MTESPRMHGMLDVTDGQSIYWEEWGAPDGVPALYLHGGPGGTLGNSGYRNRFDLNKARVIGFEQRGCGRSLPHAGNINTSLAANTTAHLIADIESLRKARGIESWILNGVSWGSTLALAYAQAHPNRVTGIVLFAVTTSSQQEVDWISEGVGTIFPEAWDRFASFAERSGIGFQRGMSPLVQAYAKLLIADDPAVRDAASHEWALWEDTHVSIGAGGFDPDPRWKDDSYRIAFARLTTHYWAHMGFCHPPLIEGMDLLREIPATLIHGRRDISGPAITAWELHRRWPGSMLIIDDGEGHGGPSMIDHWNQANAKMVNTAIAAASGN